MVMAFAKSHRDFLVGLGCLAVQILCNLVLHQFKFKDRESWKSFPYFIVKDITAPLIWIAGLVSNKVNWRGQVLHLRFGGKLGTKYMRSARIRRFQSRLHMMKF
jgi:hypothetical protein